MVEMKRRKTTATATSEAAAALSTWNKTDGTVNLQYIEIILLFLFAYIESTSAWLTTNQTILICTQSRHKQMIPFQMKEEKKKYVEPKQFVRKICIAWLFFSSFIVLFDTQAHSSMPENSAKKSRLLCVRQTAKEKIKERAGCNKNEIERGKKSARKIYPAQKQSVIAAGMRLLWYSSRHTLFWDILRPHTHSTRHAAMNPFTLWPFVHSLVRSPLGLSRVPFNLASHQTFSHFISNKKKVEQIKCFVYAFHFLIFIHTHTNSHIFIHNLYVLLRGRKQCFSCTSFAIVTWNRNQPINSIMTPMI